MNRSLDQLNCDFNQHRNAQTARTYACQQQSLVTEVNIPDDPDDDTDDGEKKREESEGETE
ncbi:hypothetical protein HanXRQr2_Chr16g0769471 [Helianthus annuus]|uniref:Uncharacterized protein n=1 Tax=Helianthus annuus TaxID=4232 RepID=A0A9K3H205_HELAN|nr:hypothetical protein HanXRQr2_Chr16g0769471 [Helianthus annuus]KAJ0822910.1 hypothetical protein HanPSC8_Chr16g0737541 [Helianthus annuus]